MTHIVYLRFTQAKVGEVTTFRESLDPLGGNQCISQCKLLKVCEVFLRAPLLGQSRRCDLGINTQCLGTIPIAQHSGRQTNIPCSKTAICTVQ